MGFVVLLVVGAHVGAAVLVLKHQAHGDSVSLRHDPPEGLHVESLTHTKGWLETWDFVRFRSEEFVLSAGTVTYPNSTAERLLSYTHLPPAHAMPNFSLGIESPELEGMGFGNDTVQCADGQPGFCEAWVYWSHRDHQLLAVVYYGWSLDQVIREAEFRDLVGSVFEVETASIP